MMKTKHLTKDKTRLSKTTKKRRWLIFVLVLGFLAFWFGPQVKTLWEMHQEIQALQEQKAQLLKKKAELTRLERHLHTDEAIEKLAREQLGMVKPGEMVMVEVIPEEGSTGLGY